MSRILIMNKIETPYEQVDFNTVLDIGISNAKLVADRLYGPVYTRLAKKYAMEFVAKKLGEKPPEGSEDWDWSQVKDYLEKNHTRYPYSFTAIMYGLIKTEITLQGKSGAAVRISINEMIKSMNKRMQWLELMHKMEGSSVSSLKDFLLKQSKAQDFAKTFKDTVDRLVVFKLFPPKASYGAEDGNTVKFAVENCAYKDCCAACQAEKFTAYNGTSICSIARMICTYLEIESGVYHDYLLVEFAKPRCTTRIIKTESD